MKLLVHTCCAPCSVQCIEAIAEEGLALNQRSFQEPDLFWYNPNIHPYTEYVLRRDALRCFAKDRKLPLIMQDDYGLRLFISGVEKTNSESFDDSGRLRRCAFCYRLRLEKAAALASERSYDAFSTTLLISPYQNHELIRKIGEELAGRYGLSFFYRDFRPRFRAGQAQAREACYYMQKYCGCIYSEEERYLGK